MGRSPTRPRWVRALWAVAGGLCLLTGLLGVVLPLLPTTPFVLLAGFCFSQSSQRLDTWLLTHPRWGASVRAWRERHAVPPVAKKAALTAMLLSSVLAGGLLPVALAWVPAACCAAVAWWLWHLPDA